MDNPVFGIDVCGSLIPVSCFCLALLCAGFWFCYDSQAYTCVVNKIIMKTSFLTFPFQSYGLSLLFVALSVSCIVYSAKLSFNILEEAKKSNKDKALIEAYQESSVTFACFIPFFVIVNAVPSFAIFVRFCCLREALDEYKNQGP